VQKVVNNPCGVLISKFTDLVIEGVSIFSPSKFFVTGDVLEVTQDFKNNILSVYGDGYIPVAPLRDIGSISFDRVVSDVEILKRIGGESSVRKVLFLLDSLVRGIVKHLENPRSETAIFLMEGVGQKLFIVSLVCF